MNFSPLMYAFGFMFLILWIGSSVFGPSRVRPSVEQQNQERIVATYNEEAAAGLDLQALVAVIKESSSAEELEKSLNREDGINNLDLNADGVIDFIKVEEFSSEEKGSYGFSLTTEPVAGEVQEIATIQISQQGENADVVVEGNSQIYGGSAYYGGFYPIGNILLMSYLLRPHGFYASPYGYGRYPSYYGSPRTSSGANYKSRTSSYNSGATGRATGTTVKSPNSGKTATSGIKRSLRNPSSAQRSFRTRSASQALKSGGFGNASKSSRGSFGSSQNRTVRSFSNSRRSFFGGGGGGGFGK